MYTIIQHEVRKHFNLTMNEYAVADSIYTLSRRGYCNCGQEYLAQFLDLSKRTVITIMQKLEKVKLIERKGWLSRTTEKWDRKIEENKTGKSEEISHKSEETALLKVKKLHKESEETAHNNNNINTINKYKNSEDEKLSFGITGIIKLTQSQYDKLVLEYGKNITENEILNLENWIVNGNGQKKKHSNHYLTILAWFRKDGVQPESEKMIGKLGECYKCGQAHIIGQSCPEKRKAQ